MHGSSCEYGGIFVNIARFWVNIVMHRVIMVAWSAKLVVWRPGRIAVRVYKAHFFGSTDV